MLDARGLSCPMPVVMVQKESKKNPDKIEVAVDNKCSVENITRFAINNGYKVEVSDFEDDYKLVLTK